MGKILDLFNGIALPQQTKTKVLVADKLYSELEATKQDLESQLLHARAELNPLKREFERLKEKLEHTNAPKEDVDLLFNATTGTHTDPAGAHYCTRCFHSDAKRIQLKIENYGWRCMVCKKTYSDPDRPLPTIQFGGGPLA